MPKWDAWLDGLADVLGPLLIQTSRRRSARASPARPARPAPAGVAACAAWTCARVGDVTRLFTMSITDLLDDWFESDAGEGRARRSTASSGRGPGPTSPGTAYVMAHHSIGDVGDGHLGSLGLPRGRHGRGHRRAAAGRRAFGARGADRARRSSGSLVARRPGDRRGAARRRGAPAPRSSSRPSTRRSRSCEQVDRARAAGRLRRATSSAGRRRSGTVKVNLALDRAARLHRRPGHDAAEHHSGRDRAGLSIDYLEQAFQDAVAGRAATRPFADGCIPTMFDHTLAPEGMHVMSMFTQWVPARRGRRAAHATSWRPTPTG